MQWWAGAGQPITHDQTDTTDAQTLGGQSPHMATQTHKTSLTHKCSHTSCLVEASKISDVVFKICARWKQRAKPFMQPALKMILTRLNLGFFYFSEKFHSKKGYKYGLRLPLEDRGGATHPKQVAMLLTVYLVNPNSSGPFVRGLFPIKHEAAPPQCVITWHSPLLQRAMSISNTYLISSLENTRLSRTT